MAVGLGLRPDLEGLGPAAAAGLGGAGAAAEGPNLRVNFGVAAVADGGGCGADAAE